MYGTGFPFLGRTRSRTGSCSDTSRPCPRIWSLWCRNLSVWLSRPPVHGRPAAHSHEDAFLLDYLAGHLVGVLRLDHYGDVYLALINMAGTMASSMFFSPWI